MRKLADTYDWSSDPGRADHADQSNKIICTDAQLSHNGVAPLNSDVGAIRTPGEYRGMQKKPATLFNTLAPRVGCRCRSRQVLLKTVPAFFHLTWRVALLPCLFLGLCVSLAAQMPAVERIVLPAVYRCEVEKSAESSNNQLRTDRARIYTASGKTYRVWAEFDITALKGKAICGVGLRVYNNDAASHINGLRYCSVRPSTAGGSLLNQQTGFSRKYQGFSLDLGSQVWTPSETSFFQPSREEWNLWKRDANHPGSRDNQSLLEDLRDHVADPAKSWFALGFSCSGCGSEGNLLHPDGGTNPASIVLEVLTQSIQIEPLYIANRDAHQTEMYETADYQVVRRYGRGLSAEGGYKVVVYQGFPHDPAHLPKFVARTTFEGMVHEIEIPVIAGEIDPDTWGARLLALADGDRELTWLINIPRKAPVGRYKFAYILALPEGTGTAVYEAGFPKEVAVLFNPMSAADAEVYLEDEDDLSEFILADKGLMWTYSLDTGDIPQVKNWDFSQFKPIALETVLSILDQLDGESRTSAATISRHLTAMVNEEGDNGILVGAWLGEWITRGDGTDPLIWEDSEKILQQYRETGPVKYAQCWVYAGVLTTLLRCVGIPARPVVNYSSGIDADVPPNGRVRYYVDKIGNLLVKLDSDGLWSYHIWCETWLATANHMGWHVLDGTPQYFETVREGATHILTVLGPAPLNAIKNKTGGSYDIDFVIAEVDADADISNPQGTEIFVNPNLIGQFIFTKAIMAEDIMDLTGFYKSDPGNKRLPAKMVGPTESAQLPSGVAIRFFNPSDPIMGQDLTWRLELENTSKTSLTIWTAYSTFGKDNNVTQSELSSEQQTITLAPGVTHNLVWVVSQSEYLAATGSSREIHLMPFVQVEGATEFFTTFRGWVHLAQPEIEITVTPGVDVTISDLVTVLARFPNPLAVDLHDARMTFSVTDGLSIDGSRSVEFELGTIAVGQEMVAQAEVRGVGSGGQWLSVFTGADELVTKQETVDLVVMDGPGMAFPLPGTRLEGAQQTFTWSAAGLPIEDWRLTVGTTSGGDQLYDSGALGPVLAHSAGDLPTDGRPLFVALTYALDGVLTRLEYRYAAAGTPPDLVAPDPAEALPGASITIRWQANDAVVADWRLIVGSDLGEDDYFDSGVLPPQTLEAEVAGLPRDGSSVFARLFYTIDGIEYAANARYTAFKLPELTSPQPGSALPGSAVPFTWAANNSQVTAWRLQIGTTPGGNDLHDSGIIHTTEYTAEDLPNGGETVYVRLWFQIDGTFQSSDYPFTTGLGPIMTYPVDGSVLPGFATTFIWTANGAAIDDWLLDVGRSTYVDIYESGHLGDRVLSARINGLPTDGSQVTAVLGYHLRGGNWHYQSYHYTGAADGSGPELLSPVPGSVLPGFSAALQWTGHDETIANWQIWAGTGPPYNLYNVIFDGDIYETVINGLPTDGQAVDIYLRYELIGGKWQAKHYSYSGSSVPGGPRIISPLPNGLLPGATTTFEWTNAGETISAWELNAGIGPAAADIFQSGPLAADVFSATVAGLPPAGTRVRVRLQYGLLGGATQSRTYEFNNPEILVADVPGQEFFLLPEPGTAVIRSQSEWLTFWDAYWTGQDQNGRTPPPFIDFDENMVIAVYYGEGFSGCESRVAVIEEVGFAAGALQVTVAPLPDLGNCRADLSPLHLVAVTRLDIPVTFVGQVP